MRSPLPLLLLVLVAPACSKKSDAPTPPAAVGSVAAVTSGLPPAGASAAPTAASGPCKIDVAPFVIDKGARSETGVTLVRLPDDRLAVGYASGDGAPRAAIVLPEGSATVVDVDASKLPELAQRPSPKTSRFVHRVTPLAAKDLKLRVAVDFAETRADGTRVVRCGAADDEPLARFDGRSAFDAAPDGGADAPAPANELRDCRSFGEGGAAWAIAFEAHEAADAPVEARWLVRAAGLDDARALLDHKVVPAEPSRARPRAARLDRFGYTLLASAKLGDAGYFAASRYNGKLMLAKRGADWAPAGDVGDFWFGAAIGMPSIAVRDAKVVVFAPIAGKLDLYGATFPVEAKPPKPEKITIADPPGAPPLVDGAERTALSTAMGSHGRIIAAYLDGKSGKRRARVALFDEALKPEGAAFEPLGADADVTDLKVAVLADDRIVLAAVVARAGSPLTVEGAVLRCNAATPK